MDKRQIYLKRTVWHCMLPDPAKRMKPLCHPVSKIYGNEKNISSISSHELNIKIYHPINIDQSIAEWNTSNIPEVDTIRAKSSHMESTAILLQLHWKCCELPHHEEKQQGRLSPSFTLYPWMLGQILSIRDANASQCQHHGFNL